MTRTVSRRALNNELLNASVEEPAAANELARMRDTDGAYIIS